MAVGIAERIALDVTIAAGVVDHEVRAVSRGGETVVSRAVDAVALAGGEDGSQRLHPRLSVEEVGIYKPNPKVYRLAVDRLGVAASAIAFQSSNAWDAYAASAFGMQVVWCNRYGQRPERLPGAPQREIRSLAELPPLVGAS